MAEALAVVLELGLGSTLAEPEPHSLRKPLPLPAVEKEGASERDAVQAPDGVTVPLAVAPIENEGGGVPEPVPRAEPLPAAVPDCSAVAENVAHEGEALGVLPGERDAATLPGARAVSLPMPDIEAEGLAVFVDQESVAVTLVLKPPVALPVPLLPAEPVVHTELLAAAVPIALPVVAQVLLPTPEAEADPAPLIVPKDGEERAVNPGVRVGAGLAVVSAVPLPAPEPVADAAALSVPQEAVALTVLLAE